MDSTIKIDNDWWVVRVDDAGLVAGIDGECCWDDKEIRVRSSGNALMHELIHATLPDLNEEAVMRLENALEQVDRIKMELQCPTY